MSGKESPFMRNLGKYRKPEAGEKVHTDYGTAEIIRVKNYLEIVKEMELDGVPKGEIDGFTLRVEHFLKDRQKYFECFIRYEDGEIGLIDWSQYLALKKAVDGYHGISDARDGVGGKWRGEVGT